MTGPERHEQLITVGRGLFAERGFEGTSVEVIAARAGVSKPIVYEHFGGKDQLYRDVVARETETLLQGMTAAIANAVGTTGPRGLLQHAAMAFLDYVDSSRDGFRILVRDSSFGGTTGSFASLISDIATQVEGVLAEEFRRRGFDPAYAPMYSQMLVGMVALTGQWWLDAHSPDKSVVTAHLVNLAWNGLSALEPTPVLDASPTGAPR